MTKLGKIISIFGLLLLVGYCSYSMVSEVAGYYQNHHENIVGFYKGREKPNEYKGWLIAVLPEMVMIVLMAVRIEAGWKIWFTKVKIPIFNIIAQILVIIIFVITVAAAALHVLEPSIKTLSELNRESELISILKEEKSELIKESESFQDTKQPINLALTAKAKRENREELKLLLRDQQSPVLPFIEIALIFLLRIVIQMANLMLAYLIGYIYRLPSSRSKSTAGSKSEQLEEDPAKPNLQVFNNAVKGENGRWISAKSKEVTST